MLTSALALTLLGQAAIKLELRPTPNTVARYKHVQVMKQSMAKMNSTTTMTMVMKMAYSNAGSNIKVLSSIESAKVTAPANDPSAGAAKEMEKMMKGIKSTTIMDRHGKVVSVKVEGNPMASKMGSSMQGMMSNIGYPTKPVKIGDTWNTSVDLGKMMGDAMPGAKASGTLTIKNKLVGISATQAKIAQAGSGSVVLSIGEGKQAMKMNMNMTVSGTTVVDPKTGILLSTNMVSKNTMKLPNGNMTQSITQSMTKL